jgi:hypothetical protein
VSLWHGKLECLTSEKVTNYPSLIFAGKAGRLPRQWSNNKVLTGVTLSVVWLNVVAPFCESELLEEHAFVSPFIIEGTTEKICSFL